MMLAYSEERDTQGVGQGRFVDDIADHLGMRLRIAVGIMGDIAEGVEAKFDGGEVGTDSHDCFTLLFRGGRS